MRSKEFYEGYDNARFGLDQCPYEWGSAKAIDWWEGFDHFRNEQKG